MSYDPWTSSGTLKPGTTESNSVSGKCTFGGSALTISGDVYICVSSSDTTYYECWPDESTSSRQVACDIQWSTQVVMMSLTASLPSFADDSPLDGQYMPSAVLADGDQCSELWGTAGGEVDGVPLNYGCSSPSGAFQGYAGALDRSNAEWTLEIAPSCGTSATYSCTGPLVTVDVTEAWQ